MEILYIHGNTIQYTSHMSLKSTWNVAKGFQKIKLCFYLILMNLSHYMWQVATVLDSTI